MSNNEQLFDNYQNLIGAAACNDSWDDQFNDEHVDSTFMEYYDSYTDSSDGTGHADNSH